VLHTALRKQDVMGLHDGKTCFAETQRRRTGAFADVSAMAAGGNTLASASNSFTLLVLVAQTSAPVMATPREAPR